MLRKKLGICCGSRGVVLCNLSQIRDRGIFHQINILGFIPCFAVPCNLSQIDSEAFSSTRGIFPQGFPLISCVFLLFRISLLYH